MCLDTVRELRKEDNNEVTVYKTVVAEWNNKTFYTAIMRELLVLNEWKRVCEDYRLLKSTLDTVVYETGYHSYRSLDDAMSLTRRCGEVGPFGRTVVVECIARGITTIGKQDDVEVVVSKEIKVTRIVDDYFNV